MAILKYNVLGPISGKVANLVFINKKGGTALRSMPEKVNISFSEKAVAARNKMGLAVRLSRAMNGDYVINSLWMRSEPPGSCNQNKQISANYKLIINRDDISGIKLFPVDSCFNAAVLNAFMDENVLRLMIQPSENISTIPEMLYPEISLHGVIKLSDNAAENPLPLDFITLTSQAVIFEKGIPLEFQIQFLGELFQLINSYPLRNITAGLVINDRNGNVTYFSGNINCVL